MINNHINFIQQNEKYFFNIDEMDLVILRGHLLIEETLYKIIAEFIFNPQFISEAKLSYIQKVRIAQSMSLDESKNSMWKIIISINSLRNEIAHTLTSQKIKKKIDQIKQLFDIESKDSTHQYSWKENDDIKGMKYTISFCIGFLMTFHEEVKRFKDVVKTLDELYNPHRQKK